jgi:hypothetical protein
VPKPHRKGGMVLIIVIKRLVRNIAWNINAHAKYYKNEKTFIII